MNSSVSQTDMISCVQVCLIKLRPKL